MEYQMKNHVMDKIKIKYGTILNVLKYKHSSPYVWLHGIKFTKKNSERISANMMEFYLKVLLLLIQACQNR